jgi:hypothetical protein
MKRGRCTRIRIRISVILLSLRLSREKTEKNTVENGDHHHKESGPNLYRVRKKTLPRLSVVRPGIISYLLSTEQLRPKNTSTVWKNSRDSWAKTASVLQADGSPTRIGHFCPRTAPACCLRSIGRISTVSTTKIHAATTRVRNSKSYREGCY